MTDLAIGIVGCAGRMGRMLAQVIDVTDGCRLAGGTEYEGSAAIGRDLGEIAGLGTKGLPVGDDPADNSDSAETLVTDMVDPPKGLAINEIRSGQPDDDLDEYFELSGPAR